MSTAVFEHAYYIGSYMSGILYGMLSSPTVRRMKMISLVLIGVELVMYCSTLRKLLRRAKNGQSWKFFFLYSTVLVLLLTIDISVNAVWGEEMWITHRDDEGGVPAFIVTQLSVWYQALGSSSAVALIFMSDAMLVS